MRKHFWMAMRSMARRAGRRSALVIAAAAILAGTAISQRAAAMVGGAPIAATEYGRSVVMILGSSGTACTATAIGRDLLLTAAHCVQPGSEYKLVGSESSEPPVLKAIARIECHPQFEMQRLLNHLATADVALVKLAEPLPSRVMSARIGGETDFVMSVIRSWSPAMASPCGAMAAPVAPRVPQRSVSPASRARYKSGCSIQLPKV